MPSELTLAEKDRTVEYRNVTTEVKTLILCTEGALSHIWQYTGVKLNEWAHCNRCGVEKRVNLRRT